MVIHRQVPQIRDDMELSQLPPACVSPVPCLSLAAQYFNMKGESAATVLVFSADSDVFYAAHHQPLIICDKNQHRKGYFFHQVESFLTFLCERPLYQGWLPAYISPVRHTVH